MLCNFLLHRLVCYRLVAEENLLVLEFDIDTWKNFLYYGFNVFVRS